MAVRKKVDQESREPVTKEPKTPKSATSAPKRGKPKGVEGPRRKAGQKPAILQLPGEWWRRFRQYLREVWHELRKVTWPSRKETIGSTSVVLVLVLLASLFLGVVDLVLSRFVRLFVG